MVDSVTNFVTVYLGQTLCLALIVCTVFNLTHFAHLYICALCKTWAKQRFLYTIYTHILRCVYLCMTDAGGKLWKLAKKMGSVICAMI